MPIANGQAGDYRKPAVLFLLTMIFLLAATVRITNIDGPALWTDEGFTYYTFKIDLFDAIKGDRHPPFYFYTLHGWVSLVGDSILAMRWWSMLPSMVTIAVAYQLGRELVCYRPQIAGATGILSIPVLAALMMALADGENYLAQELRMYTWHVFSCALSLLAYLRYIRIPTRRSATWLLLANLLVIYTHYFGIFVLAVEFLHTLLFLRKDVRLKSIVVFVVVGLLFTPWFLTITLQQFAEEAVCFNCISTDINSTWLDFRLKWFGQQWALMLTLFLLGMVTIKQKIDTSMYQLSLFPISPVFLLVALIIVPIIGIYLLGHKEVILFAHRLVQITVPVTLLMALGIGNLKNPARALIVIAIILYNVTTVDWYRVKVPWHTMTQTIAQYAEEEELVLAEVDYEESALLYYYDHELPKNIQISTFPVWSGEDPSAYYELYIPSLLEDQKNMQLDKVKTAWVVQFSPSNRILNKLDEGGYVRTMTIAHPHILNSTINVYRYDLLPETPIAVFESGITLNAVEIDSEKMCVELWWSVEEAVSYPGYTIVTSAMILDSSGIPVAQKDSPPFYGQIPIETLHPGDVVFDPKCLETLSENGEIMPGEYTIIVNVYLWSPEGIVDIITSTGDPWIESWLITIGSN